MGRCQRTNRPIPIIVASLVSSDIYVEQCILFSDVFRSGAQCFAVELNARKLQVYHTFYV